MHRGAFERGVDRKLSWQATRSAVYETLKVTSMFAWLLFGAQAIIGVYTLAGGDQLVKNAVMAVPFGKWGTIIVMQLILIFLGMFLDLDRNISSSPCRCLFPSFSTWGSAMSGSAWFSV